VAWVETHSLSFQARHDSSRAREAELVLDDLEDFRAKLEGLFEHVPGGVTVVIHPNELALSLAAPWLPLARAVSAPAGRRYFAGWFTEREIHVLAPEALQQRASGTPGSREALRRSPRHEYAHIVLAANNPSLPPPFTPATFRRYVKAAWLCEGAAAHFSGQVPHLRAAIARRLREGGRPSLPPSPRDAAVLGGTVFSLLQLERGTPACTTLAAGSLGREGRQALEEAFARPLAAVNRSWHDHLESFTGASQAAGAARGTMSE